MNRMIRLLLLYAFIGCSSNIPSHPLYDRENKLHFYDKKISIYDDEVLHYYCQRHFEWEDIITIYTKEGRKYKIIQ